MQAVADAKKITRQLAEMLAPSKGWQDQVSAVHRALTNEHFEWAIPNLTWSRVKTWFYGEARIVIHEHMVALKELKATEEAQREHLQFIAATNRMAALLAAEGASLSRAQLEALQRVSSRQADVPRHHEEGPGRPLR